MIMAGGSIMVIGTIILAFSFSVVQLIVGRIVTGFVSMAAPCQNLPWNFEAWRYIS